MQLSNRFLPQQPLLIVVVLLLGVSSLCLGQYPLSLSEVFYHLTHYSDAEGIASQVIWTVRLPRILMALLAGGALGLCGATLQGVFHNPLVDPHIIGVTSGAAFGGTLAILLGLSPLLMMGSTFFFGLTALILVYAIAALQGLENTLVLILSGIILSGFFAALVSLIQYQADTEETLPNIVFWLLGSFATANWNKVLLLAVPVGIAATVLFQLRWRINLLSLNDKDARALGVAVVPLRRSVLVCCAFLVAAQVAVSGSIAWVGLVIPHLARLLVGGIVTIPIGCIAGGLVAMYSGVEINGQPVEFTFALILMNMIPVLIVAVLVALGLKFIPEKMINGFQIFAKFLVALITLGLAAAVIKFLLGWELIPGLDPIFMAPGDKPGEVMRAIEVIGSISCVLLGAYPMVLLLTRWFEKPLMSVGNLLKVNNIAAAGMVATLANNIPMFGMMKNMDTRGKVINCAFAVSAAFALGDHLGFAAANMNAMIFPMIVGKLIGGVTAIGVAMLLVPKDEDVPAPAETNPEAQS